MTTKELIEKLKAYPEDNDVIFYYPGPRHGDEEEALYDPEIEHLEYMNDILIHIK